MAYTPQQVAAIQQAATAKALGLSTSAYQSAMSQGGYGAALDAAGNAGTGPYAGQQKTYGSNLGTSIERSFGLNPSSVPRTSSGGVTDAAITQARTQQNQAPQQQTDPYQQELDALKKQYLGLQGAYQSLANNAYQPTYIMPTVPTPATPITPTPNQSTNPTPTSGVQSAQQENPDLGIPSGSAGFTFNDTGAAGASAAISQGMAQVSPDSTYALWKQLNGGVDNDQMKTYFRSPDWQAIAAGNIPLYMASDNSWRYFLQRLGYMSPNYDTDMQNAINQKLASLQSQQAPSS